MVRINLQSNSHTEERWLLRCKVLNSMWALKAKLKRFLTVLKHAVAEKFTNYCWVGHLTYLADIYENVNELNKE